MSLGYDVKINFKPIKKTPGPGDYNNEFLTSMSKKSQQKTNGFNFLQNIIKKNITVQRNK